ncbi:hypothetical protein GGS21DRAFT_226864 [Xylaria nigripes]|nr:hypothetical protein GGS21DRAFT_226864 [Xylaria nigripes]
MATTTPNSPLLSPPPAANGAPNQSQSSTAATGISVPKIGIPTAQVRALKFDSASWGSPVGLPIRSENDENLVIFRKALGINALKPSNDKSGSLEEGRQTATGIYLNVIKTQTRKRIQYAMLQAFLYVVHIAQIVIGAALTAISASVDYQTAITVLGVVNTVLAGVLALIRGSGQPQNLNKDRIEYRRLQDWIEETEALLAVGVIGRNRREVGHLVESAFKRYNAAKTSEENNDPEYYSYGKRESLGSRSSDDGGLSSNGKPL